MNAFNIAFDFDAIVRENRIEFQYGERTYDCVTLYVNREGWRDEPTSWKIELSSSSIRTADLSEAQSYIAAMSQALTVMAALNNYQAELEAAHKARCEKARAVYDAERKAQQAAFEADAPMDKAEAEKLLSSMTQMIDSRTDAKVSVYTRGKGEERVITAYLTDGGVKKFSMGAGAIGRKALLEELTSKISGSHHSGITTVDSWPRRRGW